MITVRPAAERGHFNHGWLDTWHSFSFSRYYDPAHMGFRSLRVINEDFVAPSMGFGTHGHNDMEIITYVLSGSLAHRDSMGNVEKIVPGEVQRMTAGTGITHSEFNGSEEEAVHLLQIWIEPERTGLTPGYDQKVFPLEERNDVLRLLASHDGREGSLRINQDVDLYGSLLASGKSVTHQIGDGRGAWIQVARGDLKVNGTQLAAGDGAAVEGESALEIAATSDAEFLLFDLN